MPSLHEFVEARSRPDGCWEFTIPRELHGAFGGAFGGVVAACQLIAARSVAPGRTPNALDARFIRGLRAGRVTAATTVLHAGRTLSNVIVDVSDEQDRLCARATISLVDAGALDRFTTDGVGPANWKSHNDASPWPAVAPIVETIDPRVVGHDERGIATAIRVPWDDEGHSAEAASMAADMSVGPPVGAAVPRGVGTPNPDLSLRFCGEVTTPIVVGIGRLDRAYGGVAATRIEVYSADALVANGISTSLLLPAR